MTLCEYCDKPLSDNDHHNFHWACRQEWDRRFDNNICVLCGKNKSEYGSGRCVTCDQNSKFLDYPGGSA